MILRQSRRASGSIRRKTMQISDPFSALTHHSHSQWVLTLFDWCKQFTVRRIVWGGMAGGHRLDRKVYGKCSVNSYLQLVEKRAEQHNVQPAHTHSQLGVGARARARRRAHVLYLYHFVFVGPHQLKNIAFWSYFLELFDDLPSFSISMRSDLRGRSRATLEFCHLTPLYNFLTSSGLI